jgi:hypothetical protein
VVRHNDCNAPNDLNSLHRMVGLILDEDKHTPSGTSNVFLGVSADTSRPCVRNSTSNTGLNLSMSRKSGIPWIPCKTAGEIKPHVARTLLGRLNFTIQSRLFGVDQQGSQSTFLHKIPQEGRSLLSLCVNPPNYVVPCLIMSQLTDTLSVLLVVVK